MHGRGMRPFRDDADQARVIMRTLRVVIEGRPPTPNDRAQLWQKARETKEWREKARAAAESALTDAGRATVEYQVNIAPKTAKKPKMVTRHRDPDPMRYVARLEVIVIVPTRVDRDWDNVVASTKPLTDGLVEAGVMVGDSTTQIDSAGRTVLIEHQRGQSRVIYHVEEGDPPGTFDL